MSQETPQPPQPPQPAPSDNSPAAPDARERFGADTRDVVSWPYSRSVYVGRLLWKIVHTLIWPLCWHRLPWLRCGIVRLFGGKVGRVDFCAGSWIEMPWDVEIGDHVCIGPRTKLYNLGGVTIGQHTLISQDVYICGGTHDYSTLTYPLLRKRVVIGDYCWIAAGAFIHPGVTIGEGAIVGARAVVTHDVEPWTIVAGNPAVFIKKRRMQRDEKAE
jgi:putative colanic acid biosynthesis acetyltransferase WcaF